MNGCLSFVIGSWNVRGLGDPDKCDIVRATLLSAKPSFVCLQESKLGDLSVAKASSFLPLPLRAWDTVDSVGASGGIVSAWDPRLFTVLSSVASRHALSVDLALTHNGSPLRVTNVYAPCDRASKIGFLHSLGAHDPGVDLPWLIAGDFNLTRDPADRNNANFSSSDADLFNDTINDLALFELPLRDHQFTWSNGRATPTLIRLDRVFINQAWNDSFPASRLASANRDTSDHVPLMAKISSSIPKGGLFRYEPSWGLHAEFLIMLHLRRYK
jgi:exonuclease III